MGDHPAWGVALLRMMLGVIFVMHGWYAWAIIGPRDLTDLMVRVGNPPGIATLLRWYTIAAHQIGGALLIVGCLTPWAALGQVPLDRKSTPLNSSHSQISYAVFCLKKKKEHK